MHKKEIIPKIAIMSLIFLLLIMPSVSAFYWTTYGNDFTPMWFEDTGGYYGRFDLNVTETDMVTGYVRGDVPNTELFVPYQSLVWAFNSTDNFFVIATGNHLQVYNDDLLLIEDLLVGEVTSQIDITDFSGLGDLNEVVGVFEYNNTLLQFQSYRYNLTSSNFEKTYEYNITTASDNIVQGVRCGGGECYFSVSTIYSTDFYWASSSGINYTSISPSTLPYAFEPSAWFDIDSDGRTEFLLYNEDTILMFEKDGTIDVQINSTGSNQDFLDVKMFQPDLTNDWRFAVYRSDWIGSSIVDTHTNKIVVYRQDGTEIWSDVVLSKTEPIYHGDVGWWDGGKIAISSDYNGDFLNDIYVVGIKNHWGASSTALDTSYKVYRGYDGQELFSTYKVSGAYNFQDGFIPTRNISLVIADMNGDDIKDFIFKNGATFGVIGDVYIVDGSLGSYIFSDESVKVSSACIPADLDFDGFLDVLCSGGGGTTFFKSGGINLNSYLTSVGYSPSITLNLGQTLTATISASDNEGDDIYYRNKCSDVTSWTFANTNNVKICEYTSVGTYNMSVGVKDAFHSDYVIFSQEIIVTTGVVVCDNDGICESGETALNCPNDCGEDEEYTQTEGGISVPVDLVNPNNLNQGFLPQVYYGTLAFFSGVLQPMIVLVFVIFFALIILTIGGIIKKIGTRVGEMGR